MRQVNLPYLLPRVIRHFLPEGLTRFLLLHSLIIRPGLETVDPWAAVDRYVDILKARHNTLTGKRVMVFGYGGRFDVGIALLEAGAGYVVLFEKYAPADDVHNSVLLMKYPAYVRMEQGKPRPHPEHMTLLQGDIHEIHLTADFPALDLVLSSSVYEHLNDVDGITSALASLTKPDGIHIHFVDLRDHFFKYPFEMLTYSENTWRKWLNPTSNHNRLRIWDYRRVFHTYFNEVSVVILQHDEAAFGEIQAYIQPEFISNAADENAVTLILVEAFQPRRVPKG
jgi:SAM-dependent methyltransferase